MKIDGYHKQKFLLSVVHPFHLGINWAMKNSAQLSVKLYWWHSQLPKFSIQCIHLFICSSRLWNICFIAVLKDCLQVPKVLGVWTVVSARFFLFVLLKCFRKLEGLYSSVDCFVLLSASQVQNLSLKHFSDFLILFNRELQCLCCYSIFPNNVIKKWWVKWIFSITLGNLGAWGTVNKKFLCKRDKHGITYWKE